MPAPRRKTTTKRTSRKAAIDAAKAQTLLDGVAVGMSLDDSCQLAGVPRSTFFDWIRKGRQPGARKEYRDLVAKVDLALAQFKQRQLAGIDAAGGEEWQARAWLLERKFPSEFGRRTRLDSNVTVQAQPFIDASKLTLAEQEQLLRLLRKASPAQEELAEHQRPALELVAGGAIDGEVTEQS